MKHFLGAIIVLPILFIVSIFIGLAVGEMFSSTAGLIGAGGFSDATVGGVGIGLLIFPILSIIVAVSIGKSK